MHPTMDRAVAATLLTNFIQNQTHPLLSTPMPDQSVQMAIQLLPYPQRKITCETLRLLINHVTAVTQTHGTSILDKLADTLAPALVHGAQGTPLMDDPDALRQCMQEDAAVVKHALEIPVEQLDLIERGEANLRTNPLSDAQQPVASSSSQVLDSTASLSQVFGSTLSTRSTLSTQLLSAHRQLTAHAAHALELASEIQEPSEIPRGFLSRKLGSGVLIGDDSLVQEIQQAIAAWDAENDAQWRDMEPVLTVPQRKLLVHATSEMRLAKRAWKAHKQNAISERHLFAQEIRLLVQRLKSVKPFDSSKNLDTKEHFAAATGDSVDISKTGLDVLRAGAPKPIIATKPAELKDVAPKSVELKDAQVQVSNLDDKPIETPKAAKKKPVDFEALGIVGTGSRRRRKPMLVDEYKQVTTDTSIQAGERSLPVEARFRDPPRSVNLDVIKQLSKPLEQGSSQAKPSPQSSSCPSESSGRLLVESNPAPRCSSTVSSQRRYPAASVPWFDIRGGDKAAFAAGLVLPPRSTLHVA